MNDLSARFHDQAMTHDRRGALPEAPLSMPSQSLERAHRGWFAALLRLPRHPSGA